VLVKTAGETLPRLFHTRFGGAIRKDKKKKDGYEYWSWQASDNIALAFLKIICPYLKLKKPQAEVAIAFQERKASNKNHGRSRLSLSEIARRESERELLKKMKRQSYE